MKLAEERAKYFLSEDHVTIQIISDLENDVEKVRKLLEIIASYLLRLYFYLPSCLGQETTKRSFSLLIKLPPAHLSPTQSGGFTMSLLMLKIQI